MTDRADMSDAQGAYKIYNVPFGDCIYENTEINNMDTPYSGSKHDGVISQPTFN